MSPFAIRYYKRLNKKQVFTTGSWYPNYDLVPSTCGRAVTVSYQRVLQRWWHNQPAFRPDWNKA